MLGGMGLLNYESVLVNADCPQFLRRRPCLLRRGVHCFRGQEHLTFSSTSVLALVKRPYTAVSGTRKAQLRKLVPQAAKSAPGVIKDLPIFPLQGVVAFPATVLPLLIFEARYRVLFNTLLYGAKDLEDGLVQHDSPFCGTQQFGLCWVSKEGGMAQIGTTLQIQSHARLADGRMTVENKGVERFRVLKVKEEMPVMICEVEVLAEDDETNPEAVKLAEEVSEVFENLLNLNLKMGRIKRTDVLRKWIVDEATLKPTALDTLRPNDLSYWMAAIFAENPLHQQSLLQENSVVERLKQEKEVLTGTMNFLRAKYALMTALEPSTGESEAPPPGGPD